MVRAGSPAPAVVVSVLLHAGLLYAAVTGRPAPAVYKEEAIALDFAAVRGSAEAAPSTSQEAAPPAPPTVKTASRPPAPTPLPSPFAPPAPAAEPLPSPAAAPPQPAPAAAPRGDATPTTAAQPAAPRADTAPPRKGAREGMEVDAPHGKGADYMSRLRSWLEAHKTYPKRAKMMRLTGVTTVRFAMDRSGRLLSCEVVTGSGHADLDREAIAMLHRATPFPAPPHTVKGERIEVTTPIEFALLR